MPMLDPLATFLMRVQAAGNDVDPVSALFSAGRDATADQKAMRERHEQEHLALLVSEYGPERARRDQLRGAVVVGDHRAARRGGLTRQLRIAQQRDHAARSGLAGLLHETAADDGEANGVGGVERAR